MKKTVEIDCKPTTDELAEILFGMDNKEVAELFSKWHQKFETNFKEQKEINPNGYYLHSLFHFFLYVIDDLDENGISFFRDVYASILGKMNGKIIDEHLKKIEI